MEQIPEGHERVFIHPFHHHELALRDTRDIYKRYDAKWRCDCCKKAFDGMSEEECHRNAYHCHQCTSGFDLCTDCFKGYRHQFHRHRLMPAKSTLCYPQTDGQWRCDACKLVYGKPTGQRCYHCGKCNVDLCEECFQGKWQHTLHNEQDHTLKPVDPHIAYRCYKQWSCDQCRETGSHAKNNLWVLFNCEKCSFDLCFNCFSGRQHQLHFHGLVAKESKNSGHRLYCSRCTRQLPCHLYYACRDPNCMFTLCSACFSTPPTPHPFHPQHILLVTDPRQAYPQSGGVWHCDNCTNNHAQHRPSPLTVNDVMYHCERCQYDLCELCYKRGFSQNHVVQTDRDSLWSNGGPCLSRQHSYFTDDTQYQRVRKARPSVTELPFMPNPLLSSSTTLPSASPPHAPTIPTRTACRSCGTAPAKFTLVHSRTVPPHKAALYCLNCAWEVKKRKDPCPLCGLTADDIEEV